jgi:hypothetical protein
MVKNGGMVTIPKWMVYEVYDTVLATTFSSNLSGSTTLVAFQQLSFPALAQPVHASSELP